MALYTSVQSPIMKAQKPVLFFMIKPFSKIHKITTNIYNLWFRQDSFWTWYFLYLKCTPWKSANLCTSIWNLAAPFPIQLLINVSEKQQRKIWMLGPEVNEEEAPVVTLEQPHSPWCCCPCVSPYWSTVLSFSLSLSQSSSLWLSNT